MRTGLLIFAVALAPAWAGFCQCPEAEADKADLSVKLAEALRRIQELEAMICAAATALGTTTGDVCGSSIVGIAEKKPAPQCKAKVEALSDICQPFLPANTSVVYDKWTNCRVYELDVKARTVDLKCTVPDVPYSPKFKAVPR